MRHLDHQLPRDLHEDEFIVRRRIPTLMQFFLLLASNYAVIVLAYLLSGSLVTFAAIALFLLAITTAVAVWSVQQSRDLVLFSEFQNALFSSALGMHNTFCLIVRQDGAVVYTDQGFKTLFPEFEEATQRNVTSFFTVASMVHDEASIIDRLISSGESGVYVTTVKGVDRESAKMVLSVDPLRKPQGYTLVRGRPYVQRRVDVQS